MSENEEEKIVPSTDSLPLEPIVAKPNDMMAEQPKAPEAVESDEDEEIGADGKFRNKVLYLPVDVIAQINNSIDLGWRSGHIHSLLRTRFVDRIKVPPSRSTIEKYVQWYLVNREKAKKEEQIFEVEAQQLNAEVEDIQKNLGTLADEKIPTFDKQKILEVLVKKSINRITNIERWQKTNLSPAMENCLIRYFAEIRNLIEILAKLNNEMKPDKEIIVNIIDAKVQPMVMSFYKVLQIVAPDKIEQAKLLLKEEMRKTLTYESTSSNQLK